MSGSLGLSPGVVHVWRVPLADEVSPILQALLEDAERARADRFLRPAHGQRFTIAHAWKRRLLAGYTGISPQLLRFATGPHGKPSLNGEAKRSGIHFNLSHSGDLAVVAISHGHPVGVDVERWDRAVEHLDLANRFFSPAEREALSALAADPLALTAGFFACWSRKEAYLKATGYGIARGLHHFDVTLTPGVPARLLADRLDESASSYWDLVQVEVPPGYSGALVAVSPLRAVVVREVAEWPLTP